MKRLVYSPLVQAFAKTDDGVFDLSPYIVSGTVTRKVNQVSSAQLTLRNPIQSASGKMLFTEYGGPHGHDAPHPLLHPMDPIVIILQRLQGHPVQVFTGYIDKAPYLQLYPGLCSLEASCTLKRLLYTQWDAALPNVQQLLNHFGWYQSGSGVWNLNAEAGRVTVDAAQIKGQFTDGSIGALLFVILNVIGNWDASTIWIEALPTQVAEIVITLYKQIVQEINQGENSFRSLLSQLLGTGSIGSGGPTSAGGGTVGSPSLNANQQAFGTALSQATGLDPNVVAAWVHSEEPASSAAAPNGANNWLNIGDTGSANYGGNVNVWNNAQSAGTFTAKWLAGASLPGYGVASAGVQAVLKTAGQSPATQIAALQNSGWASSGYPTLPGIYQDILKAGGNQVTANTASTAAATNTGTSPSDAATPGNQKGRMTTASGRSPGGRTGDTSQALGPMTAFEAMTRTANAISKQNLPYIWGGGHPQAGTPSGGGYDCSGSVAAVLFGANLYTGSVGRDDTFINSLLQGGIIASGAANGSTAVNLYDNAGSHIFMSLGGQFFGTSDGAGGNHNQSSGGAGWLLDNHPDVNDPAFHVYHMVDKYVNQSTTYKYSVVGTSTLPDGTSGSTLTGATSNSTNAAAFAAMLNLPSAFDQADAWLFTGKRAFIADSPLFPFITQLAQASLRNFMSMPNGNFFAFFPDYFGYFGREPYWEIRDIEIIDGRIDFSDDPLYTHMAVAGDVNQTYTGSVDTPDLLRTGGIFDIFDAFATGYIGGLRNPDVPFGSGFDPAAGQSAALAFLQKYGARPYVEEVPAIRSPFFELFLAFQNFMLAWSRQYNTTFELTFMPELFPGGLVALPDHHIKCYVEEVEHSFDYTSGFTTNVTLSSPSAITNDPRSRKNVSDGMARAAALQKSEEAFSKAKLFQLQARGR